MSIPMIKRPIINIPWLLALLVATPLFANPQGAQVISGSATLSQPTANVLNVTNSANAIINWQSFNIGRGQTTNFIQPGVNSAVLNRVLGHNPSQILGNLNSNGKVFLINQHGLMVGAGAQINTAGFFGSTLNITNEDFLNGKLKFEGGGLGGIDNRGYIHAGDDGNVVLIAPDIDNGGVIEVDHGNVILAAGKSITITSLNDSSIEFEVQAKDDRVTNLGRIIAHQGAVGLFAGSLRHSGAINATGMVRNADGSISLVAQQDIEVTKTATLKVDGAQGGKISVQSHHGDVYFSGMASAVGSSLHGGHVAILGDRVGLFDQATIDASGASGGGEVLIGGDYQGGGTTQRARQTGFGAQASIHADATQKGDGGKVILWSDASTRAYGQITAKGGKLSGDGGFVEVSSKGGLGFNGQIDVGSPHGEAGSVLFDPTDVTIATGGTAPVPSLFGASQGLPLTINPTSITAITNTGAAALIQANRDIIVNNPITTVAGGTGGKLTLQAGQNVTINANITTDGGLLQIKANDATATSVTDRGIGKGGLSMAAGTTLDAGAGNIELWIDSGIAGTSGDMLLSNLNANHILLKHNGLSVGSSILSNTTSTITASSVFIDHDGPTSGQVGTSVLPLNLVTDNLGAHIHGSTTNPFGIFIDAQPLLANQVTVGGTCYGAGATGCATFGAHLITGLETLDGGNISLNVTGNLTIADQVQIDLAPGSNGSGNIALTASGNMINNNIITNNTATGGITFTSPTAILVQGVFTPGAAAIGAEVNTNTGPITLAGGALDLMIDRGGFLESAGIINGNVVTKGGVIDIGSFSGGTGTLTINGNLTLDPTAIAVFDIAGTTQSTGYDFLNVSGNVALDGTLLALWDTTTPPGNGSVYTLLTYGSNTGNTTFASVRPPVGVITSTPTYNLNNFVLTTNVVSPSIKFWSNVGGGNWNVAGNWTGGVVPIATDYAVINQPDDTIVINVTDAQSVAGLEAQNLMTISGAAGNLTLAGDSLLGGDQLTISGGGTLVVGGNSLATGLNITSGTLFGPGTLTSFSFATTTLAGATIQNLSWTNNGFIDMTALNVPYILDAVTLNNAGTVLHNHNQPLQLNNGTVFNNSGNFNILGTAATVLNTNAGGVFNNTGTVTKTSAGSSALSGVSFVNTGGSIVLSNAAANLNLGGASLNLVAGSALSGIGTLSANVSNNGGAIRPGGTGTVGTLTINGNLVNAAGGSLEIDISGPTTHDALNVVNGSFGGTLDVTLIGGYLPSTSDLQPIVNCSALCDGTTFATLNSPARVVYGQVANVNDLTLDALSLSFFWDGGGDGVSWFDPINWSLDQLPNATIDVTLNSGTSIDYNGTATINTLALADTLTISGGSLTIQGGASAADLDVSSSGRLVVNGGNFTSMGRSLINGNVSQSAGSLVFGGTTQFPGSLNVDGGVVDLNGSATLAGAFTHNGGRINVNATTALTNSNNQWAGGDIGGSGTLVLGNAPGTPTLAISGPSAKGLLGTLTLDMNLNDIVMTGSGSLTIAPGATLDNTNGQSFIKSGNGGILGTGTFINSGGRFNNLSGDTTLTVNLINDGGSTVSVTGGALGIVDSETLDLANYNVASGATLGFGAPRNLDGSLLVNGSMVVSGTTVTLPTNLTYNGSILLNNATLDVSKLGALLLANGASLEGSGTVNGNLINGSGILKIGGADAIGNLAITGNYQQNAGAATVVEVFNNGTSTQADLLTVNGSATLGGTLVIGFTTNSLGIVSSSFNPFAFQGSVSNRYDRVVDAGGNIVDIDFSGGTFTILGTNPQIPDAVVEELISFAREHQSLIEAIKTNESKQEAIIVAIKEKKKRAEEDEEEENTVLVCH